MKNPLRDLSRPKALALAGLAAGALTLSAAAAALNVGLSSAHEAPAFSPTPVAKTSPVQAEPSASARSIEVAPRRRSAFAAMVVASVVVAIGALFALLH